jgi:hypothetical protein
VQTATVAEREHRRREPWSEDALDTAARHVSERSCDAASSGAREFRRAAGEIRVAPPIAVPRVRTATDGAIDQRQAVSRTGRAIANRDGLGSFASCTTPFSTSW